MKKTKKLTVGWFVRRAVLLLILALAITAILYNVIVSMSGSVPKYFGYALMQVVSPSMEPDIPVGSYILIRETDPDDIAAGDIITFYSHNEQIKGLPNTHMVAEVSSAGGRRVFTTRGMANPVNDAEPVYDEDIIGRYVTTVPGLSTIGTFLRNPFVILIILVVPAFVLFVVELLHFKDGHKEENDEQQRSTSAGASNGSDSGGPGDGAVGSPGNGRADGEPAGAGKPDPGDGKEETPAGEEEPKGED